MNTLAHRLKAALPAGEWEALSFIEQPDGMMANHAWGILGRVRALRHGGIDAFIKFIVSARDGAGDVTKLVTSKARIRRLEERLHSLMGVASLPLVRILECRVLEDPDGLFIAMENVTTIDEMIRSGTANIQLATNVLRTLGGGPGAQSWHHFDICPRNLGVTNRGTVVFIDVESFYIPEQGEFPISVPAFKSFRLPDAIVQQVMVELQANDGRITNDLARWKQSFDLLMVAAQCTLDSFPPFGIHPLASSWVQMLALLAPEPQRALAEFWQEHLSNALSGQLPDLRNIADEIERFCHSIPPQTPNPRPAYPLWEPSPEPEINNLSASEFGREWKDLAGKAQALRKDSLSRAEIADYRAALEGLSKRYPSEPLVWQELLLVIISYQRNPMDALAAATEAVTWCPGDSDLERWHNIITLWVKE